MQFFNWLRIIATTVGGRISLGLAAFMGLFWLQFDLSLPPADPEKILAICVALGAWIWAELLSIQSGVHPHDVQLMQKLRDRFQDEDREFLRTHDFGNGHMLGQTECIRDFGRLWTGAAYEFHDQKMQDALVKLVAAVADISNSVALYTAPAEGNALYMTSKSLEDIRRGERSERTKDNERAMNQKAQVASDALDAIERLAKTRLRM